MSRIFPAPAKVFRLTSPAVWVLSFLALSSAGWVLSRPEAGKDTRLVWTFSRPHAPGYLPVIGDWKKSYPGKRYELVVIDYSALERRMLSGFMSGTPVADLMEVERNIAARAFTGPLEEVGFVDLTDRLRAEGAAGDDQRALLQSLDLARPDFWASA